MRYRKKRRAATGLRIYRKRQQEASKIFLYEYRSGTDTAHTHSAHSVALTSPTTALFFHTRPEWVRNKWNTSNLKQDQLREADTRRAVG